MTDLKTNPSLLNALERAAATKPSADQLRKQRISFIIGSLKDTSDVTRDKVRKILAEQEGLKDQE
jgi:hypothetical protein